MVLQNGLGVEETLRQVLPDDIHLLGGLCFICAHRSALGVVEHQAIREKIVIGVKNLSLAHS